MSKKQGYRNGAIKALKIYELPQNIITTRYDNSSTQISLNYRIKILRETEESSNSILAQMQKCR